MFPLVWKEHRVVAATEILSQETAKVLNDMAFDVIVVPATPPAVLLADHERVRSATASMPGLPRVTVEPVLPPDILGLYVLIPGGV
jgi:hypothetical protein